MLFSSRLSSTPSLDRQRLPHNTLEAVLVPLDGLVAVDLVRGTDSGLGSATLGDTLTWAGPAQNVSTLSLPSPFLLITVCTHMQQ